MNVWEYVTVIGTRGHQAKYLHSVSQVLSKHEGLWGHLLLFTVPFL